MELKQTPDQTTQATISGQLEPAAQTPQRRPFGFVLMYRFAGWLFRVGLIGLAVTTAAVLTFGSPDATKAALRSSGAYEQAAKQLADHASQEATQTAGQSLDNAAVSSAAQASIAPAMVQHDVEGVVDASYGWLHGDTQQLSVSVDLSPYINSFTGRLGDQTLQRVTSLPPCTATQLQQIDPNNVDVFNLPCRPTGLDLNNIKNQAVSQLTGSNEFLSNPVVGTTSLPKDAQGKTAVDRAAYMPQVFQLALVLPWLFAVAAAVGLVTLLGLGRQDMRGAVYTLARRILTSGIVILVFVAIVKLFFWFTTRPNGIFGKLTAGSFSNVIMSFTRSLETVFDGKLLLFGITYALLGIAGILVLRFTRTGKPTTDS